MIKDIKQIESEAQLTNMVLLHLESKGEEFIERAPTNGSFTALGWLFIITNRGILNDTYRIRPNNDVTAKMYLDELCSSISEKAPLLAERVMNTSLRCIRNGTVRWSQVQFMANLDEANMTSVNIPIAGIRGFLESHKINTMGLIRNDIVAACNFYVSLGFKLNIIDNGIVDGYDKPRQRNESSFSSKGG